MTVGCSLNGRELASGTAAGLLAFKPQAASLVGLWLLVRGRWRTAATTMSVGVGWYLVGTTAFGTGWPMRWMVELVEPFLARYQGPASLNSASPVEILRQGVGGPAGWALVVLGLAAGLWWILSVHRRTGAADWTIAGVALATVAVALHSFLYELGLAAPAVVLVLLDGDLRLRMAAGVVIAGSLTIWTLTPYLGAAVTLAVLARWFEALADEQAAGPTAGDARPLTVDEPRRVIVPEDGTTEVVIRLATGIR